MNVSCFFFLFKFQLILMDSQLVNIFVEYHMKLGYMYIHCKMIIAGQLAYPLPHNGIYHSLIKIKRSVYHSEVQDALKKLKMCLFNRLLTYTRLLVISAEV